MFTMISAGICFARPFVNFTLLAMETSRTEATEPVRSDVGVVTHSVILAWLENVARRTGRVTIGSNTCHI